MALAQFLQIEFPTCLRCISAPLLLLLLLSLQVDAQDRRNEVQTLLAFKVQMQSVGNATQTFSGFQETDNTQGYWSSWKGEDENPCAWVGVTCTTNFTVEQLDLSGWGLYQLSSLAVLSNLTDLRQLDLSSNSLGPSFPEDIQSLTRLTRLDLSRNSFMDSIPPNISACRSLRYLSLEFNQLSGEVPDLSDLVNLQVFLLAENQLSGPFPPGLAELRSIVSIDLNGNMFNGTLPSLSNLTELLYLNIDSNFFQEFEGPMFPGARSLEELLMANNQLTGTIPTGIASLLNLKVLDISGNQLSGEIPVGFSQLMNNTDGLQLDLSQNRLTGKIPSDLLQPGPSNTISSINLSYNILSDRIPFGVADQYSYNFLDLSHNSLSGTIPSDLFQIGNGVIFTLWLQDNRLSGDIVDFIANCSQYVDDLRLANNFFSGDLSFIANISVAPDFEVLDLSNNNFTMSITNAIANPLGLLLESFIASESLTELRLGGNNFSTISLPASFSDTAFFSVGMIYQLSLQVLDLSNCHLQGEISGAVFNYTWLLALQFLNLSNNDIVGSLPESIVYLSNLTTLDLTNNKLSGPLPYIPPNSPIYKAGMYMGNPGLCGSPLEPCQQPGSRIGVPWWVLLVIITGSMTIVAASFLFAAWRLRVYHKMHQQDADLIQTLLERESTVLMSLRQLTRATNNFAESAQIGKGGFGIVYRGKLNDGTEVAIKRRRREGSDQDKEQFLNEVRILSQVSHRHLVKLLGCCMENKIALLVLEYVPHGTLQEHLRGKFGVHLSWKDRVNIATQTADALTYLHSSAALPIYHRDVKSANILLQDDLSVKVADFGISRLASLEATHVSTVGIQGTIGYIDPEYYTTFQLTDKSDVYSFGVVLLELISAKNAIDIRGDDSVENISLVRLARPHIKSGDLQELIDKTLEKTYRDPHGNGKESILNVARLALKCLDVRPKARPSMKDVWNELQAILLNISGTSKHWSSFHANDGEDSEDAYLSSFPESSLDTKIRIWDNDSDALEMIPLSPSLIR